MGTKLKNRHKLAVFLIAMVLMISSMFIISGYSTYYDETVSYQENVQEQFMNSQHLMETFVKSCFVLYNQESQISETQFKNIFDSVWDGYASVYPYMDYQVSDENGTVLEKEITEGREALDRTVLESYALGIVISYDENGTPDAESVAGNYKSRQTSVLKKQANNPGFQNSYRVDEEGNELELISPINRTYMFGLTEESLQEYMRDNDYYYTSYNYAGGTFLYDLLVLSVLVCAAAILLPLWKSLHTGEEKIFLLPLEIPAIVCTVFVALVGSSCGAIVLHGDRIPGILDFMLWTAYFAVLYWTAGSLRMIGVMGLGTYLRQHCLTVRGWGRFRNVCRRLVDSVKRRVRKFYQMLDEINLEDKNNQTIFKIVLVNFIILLVLCTMWLFGVVGLVVYSVLLFILLQKYFNDLKNKYKLLLKATNEIAEGNLDVEITGNLGVFTPFRTEMEKIQTGFKKAVDQEVKSQHMKTELITNVSHDLKTPLTAIITYVNLLKEEKDEEKRQDYIDVLERKSLRLKVLIEDLFEISKASSRNVTLELVQVDIVNLFKQVKLELEDKIEAAGLEFKMSLPEEKLILTLDSQKTYRIFENLLVNVTKYALPHTRVYVELAEEGQDAVIRMKNISAAELNFNPEEITERFVRGDTSRNTEGSGLGLAIAKSFVELQKGTLRIDTEADLFKVEIRWRLQKDEIEDGQQ